MSLAADERALIDPDGAFLERLRQDAVRLRQAQTASDVTQTAQLVHRLAGAAGTFGYSEIGNLAIMLDDCYLETGLMPDLAPLLIALDAV